MDNDRDGQLNFDEFLRHAYDIYKSYVEFESQGDDVPTAEEKFNGLDLDEDEYAFCFTAIRWRKVFGCPLERMNLPPHHSMLDNNKKRVSLMVNIEWWRLIDSFLQWAVKLLSLDKHVVSSQNQSRYKKFSISRRFLSWHNWNHGEK